MNGEVQKSRSQNVRFGKIVLYVQNTFKTFYFGSSCSRDDERSEESCEHDDWPTTEIVSIGNDRS